MFLPEFTVAAAAMMCHQNYTSTQACCSIAMKQSRWQHHCFALNITNKNNQPAGVAVVASPLELQFAPKLLGLIVDALAASTFGGTGGNVTVAGIMCHWKIII